MSLIRRMASRLPDEWRRVEKPPHRDRREFGGTLAGPGLRVGTGRRRRRGAVVGSLEVEARPEASVFRNIIEGIRPGDSAADLATALGEP